jgi:hypothetical protein
MRTAAMSEPSQNSEGMIAWGLPGRKLSNLAQLQKTARGCCTVEGMGSESESAAASATHDHKDDHDKKQEAQTAGRVITPSGIREDWKGTDKHENQKNNENCVNHNELLSEANSKNARQLCCLNGDIARGVPERGICAFEGSHGGRARHKGQIVCTWGAMADLIRKIYISDNVYWRDQP